MLNALWVVMQFQFEYVSVAFPKMQIPIGALYNRPDQKVQILGLVFLVLFTLVLILQFLSMLFHRWGTVIEILASTRLFSKHHKYRDTKLTIQEAVDLIKEMELEKQDILAYDNRMTASNVSNDDDNNHMGDYEPDPDYDDDILPEPEPDYFDHPAVNNADNWNVPAVKIVSPSINMPNQAIAGLNVSNNQVGTGGIYRTSTLTLPGAMANPESLVSPNMRYRFSQDMTTGQQQPLFQNATQNNSILYSPRQTSLKPLQSLDARVMKQFRALEQRDPRFRRRAKQSNDEFDHGYDV
jgi:Na+-transporting methylmalonyl-CoA/oxaloacetate decarboxylase gamma subunit